MGTWPVLPIFEHLRKLGNLEPAEMMRTFNMGIGMLLVISPKLKKARLAGAGETALVARFGKMVLAEIVLGSLLLVSVSLLTYLPPAKITPPSFDLNNSTDADDLHVSINISPGLVGQNTFTVKLTSNGQPVDNVKEALLRFLLKHSCWRRAAGFIQPKGVISVCRATGRCRWL